MYKKRYITPEIEFIEIDNEISLVMQSVLPSDGPEELDDFSASLKDINEDVFS